jgi:hypothetical protein
VSSAEERYFSFMAIDGPSMDFVVEREALEPGKSFSKDAMDAVNQEMILWVGSRVMRAWQQRNEPPSYLKITVTAEVG